MHGRSTNFGLSITPYKIISVKKLIHLALNKRKDVIFRPIIDPEIMMERIKHPENIVDYYERLAVY